VGEPGVGDKKRPFAEGLAHRIVNGDIPENLKAKSFRSWYGNAHRCGAKYKVSLSVKGVVKEVAESDGEIILFIDEIPHACRSWWWRGRNGRSKYF